MNETLSTRPHEQTLWRVLNQVRDPEIPAVNVVEMGIVRGVLVTQVGDALHAVITITPTYSGCPAMADIQTAIERAVRGAGCAQVNVVTQWAPAWTTDWLSASAREKLRASAIAPPHLASTPVADQELRRAVQLHPRASTATVCPRCGSHDTQLLSQFGSTACKALYRCRTCGDPFDYFKPI